MATTASFTGVVFERGKVTCDAIWVLLFLIVLIVLVRQFLCQLFLAFMYNLIGWKEITTFFTKTLIGV